MLGKAKHCVLAKLSSKYCSKFIHFRRATQNVAKRPPHQQSGAPRAAFLLAILEHLAFFWLRNGNNKTSSIMFE